MLKQPPPSNSQSGRERSFAAAVVTGWVCAPSDGRVVLEEARRQEPVALTLTLTLNWLERTTTR